MRSHHTLRRLTVWLPIMIWLLSSAASAATFTVTNTANSGAGSLRQAITNANGSPGSTIKFNIPTSDANFLNNVFKITPASALPSLTADGTILDASTQTDFSGDTNAQGPEVLLSGSGAGAAAVGLTLTADNCRIKGLTISLFGQDGVLIAGGTGNIVRNCYIGTNATGTTAQANGGNGVRLNNATNNVVGGTSSVLVSGNARNVISGNAGYGVAISLDANGNKVQGNYIGTNANGTAAIPNQQAGVGLFADVSGNVIGGAVSLSSNPRNLISGNARQGTYLSGAAGNAVRGNWIGPNAAGTGALPNGLDGISIASGAHGNTIGGAASEGNLISGNSQQGIHIAGATTELNFVEGNAIGPKANGTAALPNGQSGVLLDNGTHDNYIGSLATGRRNVISGNAQHGIRMTGRATTANQVQANYLGLNTAGSAALPNGTAGVQIDGSAHGNVIGGIATQARNVISGNTAYGVRVTGASTTANQVQANYIGTDPAGTAAIPNGQTGVHINSGASNNTIGGTDADDGNADGAVNVRNVISGNGAYGVQISGTNTKGNRVRGNRIGTNAAGTAKLPNGQGGVLLFSGAQNNLIGGPGAPSGSGGAGNLISGNANGGILITSATTTGNTVQGNRIGTNAAGSAAIAGTISGVQISNAPNNTIGGTTSAARNVISGNSLYGVAVYGASATGNLVQGNYIGTDAAGSAKLPNGTDALNTTAGVIVHGGAANNTIGGTTSGARNVISGNAQSGLVLLSLDTTHNTVQGNFIGTDAAGTAALANGRHGVDIASGTQNTIGGALAGEGNRIAFNAEHGVQVTGSATTGHAIRGNRIFGNGKLGLNLGSDGVTANDANDPDSGPNHLQNYPVITALAIGGDLLILGSLDSVPNKTFALDFYHSASQDSSNFGEGENYAGSQTVTTDANGDVNFLFHASVGLANQFFTVTAMRTDTGDTSEFSQAKKLGQTTSASD